jgi:hypoxia up-regulated 1
MAPPGRRKHVALFHLITVLVLFLSSTVSAASAVVGIDLGTEYLKAALVKPGSPLEIVLTKDSKRKEAAAVAFKPSRAQTSDPSAYPERLYGGDAVALAARFPGDVYGNLKSLLGVASDSSCAKDYQSRYPGLSMETVPRRNSNGVQGTVSFKSQVFDKTQEAFMVEELLAMELQNIRTNAEAAMGKGSIVTDAVITCPAFYTAEEKRAIELAADLAGLRVLGLISEGLAVGLNFATSRTFESVSNGAKPEYHLVYDMGAGSTTATVLRFQGRTVKDIGRRNKTIQEVQVMGTGWDATLGGDILNALIVDDMVAKFVERPKVKEFGVLLIHIKEHPKTMARFWKEAERLRHVLSANSQTSASFEGLFSEDINFQYKLSRVDFEQLAAEHARRVSSPITAAMDAAGVTLSDLESIILHGGAVRTPFVQKQLEIVVGVSGKIKTNVNADEAAVMGAAFKAAGLSSSFRVKDVRAIDSAGFQIDMKTSMDGKERQQKLFTTTSPVGTEKQLPLRTLDDFKLHFIQTVDTTEMLITEVVTANLTASVAQLKDKYGCAPSNISTSITVRLSPVDGLPEVVVASVSCETDSATVKSVMDNVKGLFGFGARKDEDQQPIVESVEDLEETPLPVDDPTSSSSTVSTTSTSTTPTKSPKVSTPTATTVSIPVAFATTPLGLNIPPTESLDRIRSRLAAFDKSDKARTLRSEALNTLEAFTYRARDYLSDKSFIAVSTDKVRGELEAKLNAASEWLYGDGVDAKSQDFKDKLKELQAYVDPILSRREESSKREEAIQKVKDQLEQMVGMIQMVESSVERAAKDAASAASTAAPSASEAVSFAADAVTSEAAKIVSDDSDGLDEDPYRTVSSPSSSSDTKPTSIPEVLTPMYTAADLSTLQKSFDSAKTWLADKLALQEKLSPYDDPAVLVAELDLRAKQLQTEVTNMIMKSVRMPSTKKSRSSSKKESKPKTKKSKGKTESSSTIGVLHDEVGESTTTATTTKSSAPRRRKEEL